MTKNLTRTLKLSGNPSTKAELSEKGYDAPFIIPITAMVNSVKCGEKGLTSNGR
jgi:hypothetical protein